MVRIDLSRQQQFFDDDQHQYAVARILQPPRHTEREIAAILDRLKDVPRGSPVADFGAGTGRLTIPLLRAGFSVIAVDVSDVSLATLRTTAAALGMPSVQTASALPAGQKFAAIAGTDILHHVDLDEYLPILHDALDANGRIVFSEPGALNPFWYAYLPLIGGWAIERGIVQCSLRNLYRRLQGSGFQDVRISGLGLFPRSLFAWSGPVCHLNDRLGDLPGLRTFAYRFIIEARRGSLGATRANLGAGLRRWQRELRRGHDQGDRPQER